MISIETFLFKDGQREQRAIRRWSSSSRETCRPFCLFCAVWSITSATDSSNEGVLSSTIGNHGIERRNNNRSHFDHDVDDRIDTQ
jgi:hypothetical protein